MVKGNIKTLGYEEKKKVPSFAKEARKETPNIKVDAGTITIFPPKEAYCSANLKVAIESIIKVLNSLLDHNDFKAVDKTTDLVYRNMESAKKHLKHGIGYVK